MKKRLLTLFVAVMLALTAGALFACSGGKHKITVNNSGNGSVELSVSSAAAGDSVSVKLVPDSGYVAESATVNDAAQEIADNAFTFTMPDSDVTVSVVFAKQKYGLNYIQAVGGSVTAAADAYESGASVTLVVKPDYGYTLSSLSVDGSAVEVASDRYTFTMPDRAVDIAPVFTTNAAVERLPENSQLVLNAAAPAGETATANVFVDFGADGVDITAYVKDSKIIDSKDGMRFYFGKTDFADGKLSAANIAVETFVDGAVSVLGGEGGSYSAAVDAAGFDVDFAPWSVESGKVEGYKLTLSASYAALGVTAANAREKLTVLPYLVNSDMDSLTFGATETTIDDYYTFANPDTYPTVSDSGFVDNYYMFGKNNVGAYKDVVGKGDKWNTEKDYAYDSDNYAAREITLGGHDNADNNIAFVRSAGKTSYVRATFEVNAVFNANDKFPKFGFMVYDTAVKNSGVFFYVDAEASKTSGITLNDIVGTQLGYNSQRRGAWSGGWTKLSGTDGAFDLTAKTVTLAITYNKGFIYMYNCTPEGDKLVGVTVYKTTGDVVIGIKSFGLGLKVTDYTATNNADDEGFKAHSSRTDGKTVGDNASGYAYTEGWSIIGDLAENNGAGDQIIYVKGVEESANLYAQASVTTPDKVADATDEWTKVGMALRNDDYTIMGYVDLADNISAGQRVKTYFAVRAETGSNAGKWIWETGISSSYGTTIEDKEVEFAIAKLGENVYLLMNGTVVASYTNADIKDEKFVAGVLGFNRHMLVTDGSGSTDETVIKQKLGMAVSDGVKIDGVLDDAVWTKAVLDNTQTFAESKKNGTKVNVAAVKGADGVFVALTLYTKTEQTEFASTVPWNNINHVAFRFTEMTESNKNNAALAHFVAFYQGFGGGVSSSVSILNAASVTESVELTEGVRGYKTVVEFFVPNRYFGADAASSAELPFYLWNGKMDDADFGAMNATFKTTDMFVTANGLVVKAK